MAREQGRSPARRLVRPFAAFSRYTAAEFNAEGVKAGARDVRLPWDAVHGQRPGPRPGPGPISLDVATRAVRAALWQTAWATRVYAATAALVWWAWVGEAAFGGATATPFTAALVLLVVAALALKAFHEALRNWQLRTGRMAGAAEFIAWDGGPLWPPLPRRPR